jgi:hypothetical protein
MDVETALRRPGRLVYENGNLLRYGPEGHLQKVLQSAVHCSKPNEVRDFIRGPLNLSLASVDQLQCVTYMRWLLTTVLTQRY